MVYKKLLILIALVSMFVMMAVNTTALACTLQEPDTTDSLSNGGILNISFTSASATTDSVTAYWNVTSTLTANSSNSLLITQANLTGAVLMADGSVNASIGVKDILEDADNYIFTGSIEDDTERVTCSSTSTSITIDRTTPSSPTADIAALTVFDDVITTSIVYSVTGTDTTSCRIAFLQDGARPRFTGSNTFSMVHSGDTCIYTVKKAEVPDGTYQVYAQASDETDTAISSKRDYEIKTLASDVGSGGLAITAPIAAKVAKDKQTLKIVVIMAAAFLFWQFFINTRKKK